VKARNRIPALSKSRFMAGLQCHKRLYLECYEPELAAAPDEAAQAVFEVGNRVGELARRRFPGGKLIAWEGLSYADADRATRAAMNDRAVRAIYEGAFSFDNIRVRADILARAPGGRFDLFEVKSSTSVKPEHEWDVAVQLYVLEGARVPIRRASVMHLNREYVYPGGEYDLEQLFAVEDLTDVARQRRAEVVAAVDAMRATLRGDSPPPIPVGPHCTAPYPCPFYDHCHASGPEHPIDELPRLRAAVRERLILMGVADIPSLPRDIEGLSSLHVRIVEAVQTGRRIVDSRIRKELAQARYPVHFLDFETFNPALPLYVGTRPYDIIPFQWSAHTLTADGGVAHRDYLHEDSTDPRRPFTEALVEALGRKGSILTYSGYEARLIGELEGHLPDLAPDLSRLRDRLIDLLPTIREHVYDPGFHGSFSLKSVVPALIPQLAYDGLEVSDGGQASLAYMEVLEPNTPPDRRRALAAALRAYCKRDTEALVELFKLLG
jgi:CRISPR/Cas system-associated exonuclease Cas4 (RecB family)